MDQEELYWIVGCTVVTVTALTIALLEYWHRVNNSPKAKRKKRAQKEYASKMAEEKRLAEVDREPIMQNEFVTEWRRRQKSDEFKYEFKAVLQHQGNHTFAELAFTLDNKCKNNNMMVVPYESNRVLMEKDTDYINASWIDGFNHPKKYIATQGPLGNTVDDFWTMIWIHNCHCIVMATNVFEHARQQCQKYWHNEHGRYGSIDVWLVSTNCKAQYTTRDFKVSKGNKTRFIRQFQFESWSETENPYPASMIDVRSNVLEWMAEKPGPIVVHCSAGAGRTGTYIAIDTMLDKYEARKPIDVFRFVVELRSRRSHMVGSISQYQYIYETIGNIIHCGYTSFKVENIPKVMQALSARAEGKYTGFEVQFRNINSLVRPLSVGECAGGHRAENRWKSRDIMVQPPERARPYLQSHEHADSTDYINAVFVDGLREVNQYIVTQWPLKSTVNDIWRLVHDQRVSIIVLLNDMSDNPRSYPRFWPAVADQSTGFGPVSIKIVEEFSPSKNVQVKVFSTRKMMAHDVETADRCLVMLQLTSWHNKQPVPENVHGFIELVMLTEDWITKLNSAGPVLIVSKDGISRAGAFCAVNMSFERLQTDGSVDIYRAVETIKRNRPQLVNNILEYMFCYDCTITIIECLLQLPLNSLYPCRPPPPA